MKHPATAPSSWMLAILLTLLAAVCISETSAIVIPMPGVLPNDSPAAYIEIRHDNTAAPAPAPPTVANIKARHDNTPAPRGAVEVQVRHDNEAATLYKNGDEQMPPKRRYSKRGGGSHDRTGYVPGGTGSGNQYDKGKPYGRSL
ncbi:hypothetical protein DFQ27_002852 [Actinomortierella ambigua]|uniref:Uncharacterized protein n=1 Tax=Actinomortierella ambigua TaxID=1343610 RepID=A0A9P6QIB8_9FUNG|nr:hypothetical protein DFQ27_002852 [Actinomortierella ambigua]